MSDSGLAEAVTQGPSAAELLPPYGHAGVVGAKLIAGVAEGHGLARGIGAEPVVRQLDSSKGILCQQRLHGLEMNWGSASSAGLRRHGRLLPRQENRNARSSPTSINPEVHFRVKSPSLLRAGRMPASMSAL
jgi:hypothetical protein